MTKRVVVLDYGFGNVRSAQRALQRVGAHAEITGDLDQAARADGLVVPGVGAFAACMSGIERVNAAPMIGERVQRAAPVLGICVGMQIMFEAGDEHGLVTKGLGLVPGAVTRLDAPVVPHMGWNVVDWPDGTTLGRDAPRGSRFYFVHSYAAIPTEAQTSAGVSVATATHGSPFVAAFEVGVLTGAQFHPEKSGDVGATMLANWIQTL